MGQDGAEGRRGRGELESEVLAALWAAVHPLSAAQVLAALGQPAAYNTVQTILTRLHDKGLVGRELVGRAHLYRPTSGQAELAAERMHALLDGGRDHIAVLQRFVGRLSPADEAALRALITPDRPRPARPRTTR